VLFKRFLTADAGDEHNRPGARPVGANGICAGPRLGDQRRTQRLVKIAARLAQSPGGTLPQALPRWEELKAAYRFFSQPKITFEDILQPHWERTQEACRQAGEYLLIEDTTLLDYTGHAKVEGLGFIGEGGQGLSLHSTLALKVSAWDWEGDLKPKRRRANLHFLSCRRGGDNLNRPNAKTNGAIERNKRPADGSGTMVSTHTPGSDGTDSAAKLANCVSMEVESTTSPGWSMVIMVTVCMGFKYSWKLIISKFQETMFPEESVPKVKSCT
jgi:Transposase DNA-binding